MSFETSACSYRGFFQITVIPSDAFKIGYVFSNTTDNEESTLLKAIELAHARLIKSIGIAEGNHDRGYEGFDHSAARLKELGFPSAIPIMKFDVGDSINTLSEACSLMEYARSEIKKGRGWMKYSTRTLSLFHFARGDGDKISVTMTFRFLLDIVEILVSEHNEKVCLMGFKIFFWHNGNVSTGTKAILFERAVINQEFYQVGADIPIVADS